MLPRGQAAPRAGQGRAGHSNHSSSLPRAAPQTSECGPKEQPPSLLWRMDLGAAGTPPLHSRIGEGQSVPATEGCTRRMRMVWWDPCRPSRYSHLTSCQLTDSPSTGKARVNMMDRRGEFIQDINRQGNKKIRLYLRDARDSRRCREKEREEEFISAQPQPAF